MQASVSELKVKLQLQLFRPQHTESQASIESLIHFQPAIRRLFAQPDPVVSNHMMTIQSS